MKFKVGDKVKLNKKIKNFRHGRAGVSYEEIGTIEKIDADIYTVNFPSFDCWFGEEKELKKVEYTYEDLEKSPIGTKITFEKGNVLVKTGKNKFENEEDVSKISELTNFKDGYYGKIIKIEEPEYKTVYKYKPEILDEAEKRYLRGVIRPFRNKTIFIKKFVFSTGKAKITIKTDDNGDIWYIGLPLFQKDKMYKNMEDDKEYTLKELGL